MLSRIGAYACNQVLPSAYCNQNYGLALITGTAIITVVALKRIYFPDGLFPRDGSWNRLKERLGAAGHPLNLANKLPWKSVFGGMTGYIDGIFSSDLTKPVMWGQDPHGRKFVACRVMWWPKDTPAAKKVESFVIFQKYSDVDCLANSGQNAPFEWQKGSGDWEDEYIQFLKGATFECQEEMTTCYRLDRECNATARKTDFRFTIGNNGTNNT